MSPRSYTQRKRRRRHGGNRLFFFILIQSCLFAVHAEDSGNQDSYVSQQRQQGSQDYSKNHGLLTSERYCRRREIEVTKVTLTCDSPGAYYYGSKTYRNSDVCIDGDKVNLKVYCKTIVLRDSVVFPRERRTFDSHLVLLFSICVFFGVTVTITSQIDTSSTVYLQIDAGLYDKYKMVISPTRLCQMQIQAAKDTNQKCPRPGDYVLQSQFYLPNLIGGNDNDFHFTPDVNLTFTDNNYNRLGCAVTGTAALHRQAYLRHRIGMVALALGLFAFAFVFCGLLLLAYRRKKRLEKVNERKTQKYQYFRTLPNGQVVPFTAGQMPGVPSPSQAPPTMARVPPPQSAAYQISNPAYNETQLPTRPVI